MLPADPLFTHCIMPGSNWNSSDFPSSRSEYGQSKLFVNAHVEEMVNLPVVKGSNYLKIQEIYESVSRNYGALLTVGEADMLRGFVMSTLNKIPQVRPDIGQTDENWENWDMEALINNLR